MQGLPIADIVILVVLLISALLAFARGFVKEMLSVFAWVGAALAALYGFPYVRPLARKYVSVEIVADLIAGAAVFVVALILLSILSQAISSGVRQSAVSGLDRALGFAFGLVRGAVLICLLYIGAQWFWTAEQMPQVITEARATPMVRQGANWLLTLVPEDARRETEAAAGSARERALPAQEAEKTLDRLIRPQPELPAPAAGTPTAETPPPAYNDSQIRDMQRLIDSTQQNKRPETKP